ncbi:MAG: GTPase ObgE [Nitrospira sp.]|nr:GTPase ObgE [bacterium]MBL7031638.1 GTPase ObgE [Nitrospira sp.]
MKFIDKVKVTIKAGDGGKGCVSMRREKYIPMGGPNGGDGGRGGHIIFRATNNMSTLLDLRYQQFYYAQKGINGKGKDKHGKNGADIIVSVPVGTMLKDHESGEVLFDLTESGQECIAAHGGRGGLGNAHFRSSTNQTPKFAQPGEEGDEKVLSLELKLIADVGLVGLPNAGKSTFIASVSSATPKIADYPFTTLVPNLGVVKFKNYSNFVIADIPGLIEGAHQGTGLGFQFLRHIERTSILLHLIDISEMSEGDPIENFEKINNELKLYSPALLDKPFSIAATKTDISGDSEKLKSLAQYCKDNNYDFFEICSVTGNGLQELVNYLGNAVEKDRADS